MKKAVLLLSLMMLGAIACFASKKPTKQITELQKIELNEAWIESHYDAFLTGDLLQITLEEPGYEYVEMSLKNSVTGKVYTFKRGDLSREINISNLPKGEYQLRIFDELIFESITKIRL